LHATRLWTVLFFISVLRVGPALSQETSQSKDTLYSMALVAGVAEMQKQWGYIDDGDRGGRIRTDYHHLIVRKKPEITDDLPSQSDEFHFDYLDDASLLGRYNQVKKGFSILEVHPIHDRGPTLKIHISQSWVESHQGHLWIGISDWANVEFRFDCRQQAYLISDVKLGGI
jgi:hypothetical protein